MKHIARISYNRVTTGPGNREKSGNKINVSYGLEKSVNGGQRSGKTLMGWEKCQIKIIGSFSADFLCFLYQNQKEKDCNS